MALKFQPNKNERIFAIGYSNICSSCSKRWKPCSVSCQMSVLIHTNLSNVTVAVMPIHFGKKNKHHPFLRAPNFRRSFPSFFSPRFFPTNLGSCMPEALLKRCQAAWRPKESRSPQRKRKNADFFPRIFFGPKKMVGLRNVLVETQEKMDFFGSGSFVFWQTYWKC